MSGQFGDKEIKEIVVFAMGDLAPLMIKQLKDGVQYADALAFYEAFKNNEEFKAHMMAAYDNWSGAIDEVKDLDLGEGIDIAITAAAQVPKIIAALGA